MEKAIFAAPLGAALLAASAASAQVQSGGEPVDQAPSAVDDVVVTAQRRAQNVQDVPITMNVFGAEQVEQARIVEVSDVANRTVGLNFDAFPASQPLSLIHI